MWNLISIELYKIFRKWRTYIGFLTLGVFVPIIQVSLLYNSDHLQESLTRNLQSIFIFEGNLLNGFFVGHMLLNSLIIHIPFLITLVLGDVLAGEASAGTYRMLLIRPVSRLKIVFAKFSAGIIYTFLFVLWLAIVSLGLGLLLFGRGELIVIRSEITILTRDDLFWRFALAYLYAFLSMSLVASLAFFFSSIVSNAIGPIISTMALIVSFLIISNLPLDILKEAKPYFFTTYLNDWQLFFEQTLNMTAILNAVAILSAHIAGLFLLTYYFFRKKDILT